MLCLIVDKEKICRDSHKAPQDKYFPLQQTVFTLPANLCKGTSILQLQACSLIEETDQVKVFQHSQYQDITEYTKPLQEHGVSLLMLKIEKHNEKTFRQL